MLFYFFQERERNDIQENINKEQEQLLLITIQRQKVEEFLRKILPRSDLSKSAFWRSCDNISVIAEVQRARH